MQECQHGIVGPVRAGGMCSEILPMIGKLLGHALVETTVRYAHIVRHSANAAVARVADSLAADTETAAGTSPAVWLSPLLRVDRSRSPSAS